MSSNTMGVAREVRVDRSVLPQEALDATGCTQVVDRRIVGVMPRGEGEMAEVIFFNLGRTITESDVLEQEYERRGLVPCDPYSLIAVNVTDRSFVDDKSNVVHWRDGDGLLCFVAFDRFDQERRVHVGRGGPSWDDSWWFAGVRK